MKPLPENRLIG